MEGSGRRRALDLATAEQLCAALTAGRSREQHLADGLLAVRADGGQVVCHVDPEVADVAALDRALRSSVGGARADLLRYQAVRTSSRGLVALAAEVVRREWHPRAAAVAFAVDVDWSRELVEVTVETPEEDEVTTSLRELLGERGVVTAGAEFGPPARRRRRS